MIAAAETAVQQGKTGGQFGDKKLSAIHIHTGAHEVDCTVPHAILKAPQQMATRVSFPKVCVAFGGRRARLRNLQPRRDMKIEQGERFLEFRLDYVQDTERVLSALQAITQEFPDVTVLATCRRKENHGHFDGSVEEQCRVLSAAINKGARAVDLEIESAEIRGVPLDDLRRARLIVYYHNWDGTPALDPHHQAN